MEKEIVTTDGEINDPSRKVFSASVLSNQKNSTKNKKLLNNLKDSNKRKVDLKIRSHQPIFVNSVISHHQHSSTPTALSPFQAPFVTWYTRNAEPSTSYAHQDSSTLVDHASKIQFTPVLDGASSSSHNGSKFPSNLPFDLSQKLPLQKDNFPKTFAPNSSPNRVEVESPSRQFRVNSSEEQESNPSDNDQDDVNDNVDETEFTGDDGGILSRMMLGTGK